MFYPKGKINPTVLLQYFSVFCIIHCCFRSLLMKRNLLHGDISPLNSSSGVVKSVVSLGFVHQLSWNWLKWSDLVSFDYKMCSHCSFLTVIISDAVRQGATGKILQFNILKGFREEVVQSDLYNFIFMDWQKEIFKM